MLIEFKGIAPDVSQAAYIAENATICGDFVGGRRSGRCEEDAYIGRRPQENNDEVYIADAYAYAQAKIVG